MSNTGPENNAADGRGSFLRPGAILNINEIFAKAGQRTASRADARDIKHNLQRFYRETDQSARRVMQLLFDVHYPFHKDHTSMDNVWKRATAAGFIAGMRVNHRLPSSKVRTKHLRSWTEYKIDALRADASRGYDLKSTLIDGQNREPLRIAAVRLLPQDEYVEGYADVGESLLEHDKRDLYVAALGYTASVGLGLLLEHEYSREQPGVGALDARRMKKDLRHSVNIFGAIPSGETWPPQNEA